MSEVACDWHRMWEPAGVVKCPDTPSRFLLPGYGGSGHMTYWCDSHYAEVQARLRGLAS